MKSASKFVVAKTLAMFIALGCAGGWLMIFIHVPYISCILSFFLGLFSGRFLAKYIDHSLANKIGTIVAFGLLIGLSLSPFNLVLAMTIEIVRQTFAGESAEILTGLTGIVNTIFCPVCFIVGVMRPTVWGEPF